ncbi:hypothetical protein pb186bvf_011798 [Paramecium bursaria]
MTFNSHYGIKLIVLEIIIYQIINTKKFLFDSILFCCNQSKQNVQYNFGINVVIKYIQFKKLIKIILNVLKNKIIKAVIYQIKFHPLGSIFIEYVKVFKNPKN